MSDVVTYERPTDTGGLLEYQSPNTSKWFDYGLMGRGRQSRLGRGGRAQEVGRREVLDEESAPNWIGSGYK